MSIDKVIEMIDDRIRFYSELDYKLVGITLSELKALRYRIKELIK
jgi:hypothetical protein